MKFNRNFYRQPLFYIELILGLFSTVELITTRLWSVLGIVNLIILLSCLVGLWQVLTGQTD
ncbi:hypothetical protein [Limosilactobacillus ingluviei]|uniref:hypothetical protein n=1 Tax=Limosilactobacillus ingluviei TaxID=148604 RepID=UPI001957561F|nr:hypothetical protein [Limosilactobacillus ingluviei]MBM6727768.1 hypothetical protein [Limosilactobacillus ingluviei]